MHKAASIHITEEAFVQTYEAYWRELYLFCNKYVQDSEVSKELVQEVFISLWEKRHTLAIQTSLRHYLFGALKLKALEHYRKQAVREQYILYKKTTAPEEENQLTEKQVSYNELYQAFQTALQNMPERSRQVYHLSREQGMDNKSIAATLFITEKAVEGNITRAIAFIKKRLQFFNQ